MPRIAIDGARLAAELDHLATFSDAPAPAVTRVLFTTPELAARAWLRERFADAGLDVRQDAAGNLFARWAGSEPGLAAVATGSHIDAVPFAGRYDGTVGALGGLEALRALARAGFRPRRSLELVVFTSEEPTRFGVGCLGSRALAGLIAPDELAALADRDGVTFDDARRAAGCDGHLGAVRLDRGCWDAFVELHIEQGPRLEAAGLDLGVVTAIAAPATLELVFSGEGGHAGAALMDERRDPLPAAAELVLAVERTAREAGSPHAVATVGILELHPGASNSIPSRVRLTIDARDVDAATRDRMVEAIRAAAAAAAERRGLELAERLLHRDAPAACDPRIVEAVEAAAEEAGLSHRRMVSHAYHDTSFIAGLCPVGMIFVPSRGGHSHRPEEYTAPEQIAGGVEVLAATLARLAG